MKTKQVLVISSSPRRDGNSQRLAEAFAEGAREAGHEVALVNLNDHISHFLRDCRTCRGQDGHCTISDGYRALLYDKFLPADGIGLATPLYWYGVSGQLKTFLDRTFCYYAASCPDSERVIRGMLNKKFALLVSSEETYIGAILGVLHEIQEYARYTHSEFLGYVQGIGNKRGDVALDPNKPLARAREMGKHFFHIKYTDYRLDIGRNSSVWT